jgi:predicted enzyme related to lactoylglutathione lyase
MSNLVVHFELHASEPQRLIDFYSALLGWRFSRYGELEYWVIDTGEGSIGADRPTGAGINGGLVPRVGPPPEVGAPINGVGIVVAVDGPIDDVFARGLELGATEALPLADMAGVGRLGYLIDPDGNVFGLISAELSDGTTVSMGGGAG